MAKIKAIRVIMDASTIETLAQAVRKQVNNNDHTGAALTVAKYMKSRYYTNIFKGIEMIHNEERSIPKEIQTYRDATVKRMMKWFEGAEGKDARKLIVL